MSPRKSENVIYIPSNEEELDAEISRLDLNHKTQGGFNETSYFQTFEQADRTYNDLLESFMFSVHMTKQPRVSKRKKFSDKRKENNMIDRSTEAFDEQVDLCVQRSLENNDTKTDLGKDVVNDIGFVEDSTALLNDMSYRSMSEVQRSDLASSSYECDAIVKKTRDFESNFDLIKPPLKAAKFNHHSNQQNNFVEINILSIDEAGVDKNNSEDLKQINKRNLREIVRTLINKIFDSPRKNTRYMPLKSNYEHKSKEVKISVDELFKDNKLDFIVKDRKKVDNCTTLLSSRKFLFLQLCFLAILSIYLMSYFNATRPMKF